MTREKISFLQFFLSFLSLSYDLGPSLSMYTKIVVGATQSSIECCGKSGKKISHASFVFLSSWETVEE